MPSIHGTEGLAEKCVLVTVTEETSVGEKQEGVNLLEVASDLPGVSSLALYRVARMDQPEVYLLDIAAQGMQYWGRDLVAFRIAGSATGVICYHQRW